MSRIPLVVTSVALLASVGGILMLQQPKAASSESFAATPAWLQDFSKQQAVDTNQWNIATTELPIYNNERQIYTNRTQNVRIANGALLLQAHAELLSGKGYTSGRIDTKSKQTFRYGKIEAVMQMPEGAGTWPALWLLSNDQAYTNKLAPTAADWEKPRFYMHDGEIDIMEFIGSQPHTTESTVHNFNASSQKSTRIPGDIKGFHTYGTLWTPDTLTFTVDGKPFHSVHKAGSNPDDWPFDQPMYLILNLAMGGEMGGHIDTSRSAWTLAVKSIAFYPYKSPR